MADISLIMPKKDYILYLIYGITDFFLLKPIVRKMQLTK